jgi:hypothetical protein
MICVVSCIVSTYYRYEYCTCTYCRKLLARDRSRHDMSVTTDRNSYRDYPIGITYSCLVMASIVYVPGTNTGTDNDMGWRDIIRS